MGGGGLSGVLTGEQSSPSNNSYQSTKINRTKGDKASQEQVTFVSKVFASTEDYWTKTFQEQGLTYKNQHLFSTQEQHKQLVVKDKLQLDHFIVLLIKRFT